MYKNKYLKYKKKYLELKGGKKIINCDQISDVGFNNTAGTCWNISILTPLLYGDPYSEQIQTILTL
jgi:hypothetical protein